MIIKVPFATEQEFIQKLNEYNITLSPLLLEALNQVKVTHLRQKRDDGCPYLEQHIYPIAIDILGLYKKNTPENLILGALLHDVLEDDKKMSDRKFVNKFSKELFDIVKSLTKTEAENLPSLSEKKKMEINKRIIVKLSKAHEFSKLIKLADRANNLASAATLKNINRAKYNRYLSETKDTYLPFAKEVSPYYYKQLKKIINNLENKNANAVSPRSS